MTEPLPATRLIERWRGHLADNRRRSLHTVRAYEASAARLMAFLSGHWGGAVDRAALAKVSRKTVHVISGVSGQGVQPLLHELMKLVDRQRAPSRDAA